MGYDCWTQSNYVLYICYTVYFYEVAFFVQNILLKINVNYKAYICSCILMVTF